MPAAASISAQNGPAPGAVENDALQTNADDEANSELGAGSSVSDQEIVVRGERLRGQLDLEQEPLLELNEEDIAAEGVTSIADLVTQITNQTGSARGRGDGRPIVLINGIRVGSFREFFQYPPEALARVEVFPEEVAQRFGLPPDRRVINLILKENFASRELELEFEGPSRGGYWANEQEFGYLKIANGGRINLNFEARDLSLLTEAERDIEQTAGSVSDIEGDPNPADFRSLVSDSLTLEGNASWAKAYIESGMSLSANLNYNRDERRSLQGLNSINLVDPDGNIEFRTFGEETPLEQRTSSDTVSASGSLTKPVNAFRLTTTFDTSFAETTQEFDALFDTTDLLTDAASGTLALDGPLPTDADGGFDIADTRSISASTLTTLRGTLLPLPGGDLRATFDVGYSWTNFESEDTRNQQEVDLTRGVLNTGVNLNIPLTSRRNGFADALGSFTVNGQIGVDHLSDFGTLGDYTIGLNWSPFDNLDLSANYIVREVAPELTELGNPEVTFFNVAVFDFTTGENALVTVTTGGNPDLLAETQRDWRFAANWRLPFWENTRFTLEYIRNRSEDVTESFPVLTPEIEAAFPDRVTRDASGALIALDRRFVTFAETRADRLRIGINTRGNFGGGQREGRGGGGGPPQGAQGGQGDPPSNAARRPRFPAGPLGAGGPPSAEQREQFMAFRARLCAEDGLEFIQRLVSAVENGEDLSSTIPGFDPDRLERLLSRVRNENGEITAERLAAFRERLCSFDPAMFGGQQGTDAGTGEQRGPDRQGGPPREAFSALRERVCGNDGTQQLARIIAAIDAGEDISEIAPGVDAEFAKRMIERLRGEDGAISPDALGLVRERICSGGQQAGQAGGRRGVGFGGGNPFDRRSFRGWRYFLSLNHTIELENEILIAPGVDVLDQLDGDATGAFGFPRHNTRLEAGLFGSGVGFRLSGQYTGATRLDGTGLPGSTDILFDDLLTFDLRIFSNLADLTGSESAWLKGVRVSLRADNIFDAQRTVRDANGDTPINYQPFLIDPTGRFVGIDIRKLF